MRTPITYYGGKQRLIKELLPLVPPHKIYVEAFMGGGAFFFAKAPSQVEIINDLNGNVINFYRVVQTDFEKLKQLVNGTLHSRAIYKEAKDIYDSPGKHEPVKRAWAFWVATNQGFSGKIGSWALSKQDNKVGKTLANKRERFTSEYEERLKQVQIESKDALKVIQQYDAKDAFIYTDPPYFNSNCGHYKGYTEADYKKLLDTLARIKGMFLLSSYPSDILNEYINNNGWHHKEITQKVMVTHLTKKEKIEVLVWNYNTGSSSSSTTDNPVPRPKEKQSAIKPVARRPALNRVVRFSSDKSKRNEAVNVPIGVKNSGYDRLHLAAQVSNFDERKGDLNEGKQLSLEKCRKILEQSGKKYTDEEILKIRKLLYKIGNLDYQLFTELKVTQHEKCNPLRKGINRRTSRQRHKHPLPERKTGAILYPNRV